MCHAQPFIRNHATGKKCPHGINVLHLSLCNRRCIGGDLKKSSPAGWLLSSMHTRTQQQSNHQHPQCPQHQPQVVQTLKSAHLSCAPDRACCLCLPRTPVLIKHQNETIQPCHGNWQSIMTVSCMVLLLTTLCFRLLRQSINCLLELLVSPCQAMNKRKSQAWHMLVVNEPDMRRGAAVSKMQQSSSALDKDGMRDHVDQI